MLTQHIALVPDTQSFDASELARVSAALQKQVIQDVSSTWNVVATVSAFPSLEDVPLGYWPILICSGEIGNQAGVHRDRSGQPYALVQATQGWSLAASRACLEMLINPFESRRITATSLRSDQAAVEFLVEVCGPCESAEHAYAIDGVTVSDFCTPAYFEARAPRAERFSFNDSLQKPLQLISGGHVTWYDPLSGSWWLRNHWGENPLDTKIGPLDSKLLSVRELVQVCAQSHSIATRSLTGSFERRDLQIRQASALRARHLRSLLGTRIEQPAFVDEIEIDGAAFGDEAPNDFEAAQLALEKLHAELKSEVESLSDEPHDRTPSVQPVSKRASSLPPPLPPPTPRAPQVRGAASLAPPGTGATWRPLPQARSKGRWLGSAGIVAGGAALVWVLLPSIRNWASPEPAESSQVSTTAAEPNLAQGEANPPNTVSADEARRALSAALETESTAPIAKPAKPINWRPRAKQPLATAPTTPQPSPSAVAEAVSTALLRAKKPGSAASAPADLVKTARANNSRDALENAPTARIAPEAIDSIDELIDTRR